MKRMVLLMVLALCGGAAAQPKAKAENKPEAGVNWEGQVLRATGSGAPDMKASNPAQARLGAERAAQLDALRNLLAQAKGIQVSAGRTVGDELEKDEIRAKVDGVLRGFKTVAKRYFSDGGVELDVEVPLAALTEALLPRGNEALTLKADGAATHSGLVVDARGLKVSPALAPRLVDEAGRPIYAAEALSEEARHTLGVAGWATTVEAAKKHDRVGKTPWVVRAARAEGSDLVLAADDAKKLRESNHAYLAEGRVVIVTQ